MKKQKAKRYILDKDELKAAIMLYLEQLGECTAPLDDVEVYESIAGDTIVTIKQENENAVS